MQAQKLREPRTQTGPLVSRLVAALQGTAAGGASLVYISRTLSRLQSSISDKCYMKLFISGVALTPNSSRMRVHILSSPDMMAAHDRDRCCSLIRGGQFTPRVLRSSDMKTGAPRAPRSCSTTRALLEPCWAVLGVLCPSGASFQAPGEDVRPLPT